MKTLHLTVAALTAAALVGAPPLCTGAEHTTPTSAELANATYLGIEEHAIQLTDSLWQGEPFTPTGASRPRVGLVEDFLLTGDINHDDIDEAVVVLWQSSGGSGTRLYLAVMGREGAGVVNFATAPIGDRVQIRSGRISRGAIKLELVQQGPGDAACCPSQLVERSWSAAADGLYFCIDTGCFSMGNTAVTGAHDALLREPQ